MCFYYTSRIKVKEKTMFDFVVFLKDKEM